MKRLWAALAVAAVVLGGCANLTRSVFDGGASIVAPVQNPVSLDDLAAIEGAVGILRAAAVNYRRLGLCPAGTAESVTNLCARRSVVMQLQQHDKRVALYLVPMRGFVRNNDQISAIGAIGALRQAVADYQAVALANGIVK